MDGFAHKRHMSAWPSLIGTATNWARQQGAQSCHAVVCAEDQEKQAALEDLGFTRHASNETFRFGHNEIDAVRMVMA